MANVSQSLATQVGRTWHREHCAGDSLSRMPSPRPMYEEMECGMATTRARKVGQLNKPQDLPIEVWP